MSDSKKLDEIHAGIFGKDKLEYPGLIKDMAIVKEKLDKDHKLLLPNRMLFSFCDLIKRPLAWMIALILLAAYYGVSIADFIALKLGIK
jgi:hypothetical protein